MNWSIVVSVYQDDAVFQCTLARSPDFKGARECYVQKNFRTVAGAYNDALRKSREDVVVFIHPDVYLPPGWSEDLKRSLIWLEREHPRWGVAGMFGMTHDGQGRGFAYSTGLGQFIGRPFKNPVRVQTLDEFIFVMRKSSGLTFDEALPDPKNHFGAADVCLQAEEHGLAAFVLPCFVIHNSKKIRYLPMGFWRNYLYLRRKWRKRLPFPTPCGDVTRGCLPMFQRVLRDAVMLRYWSKERAMTNVPDPAAFYESIRPKMAKLGDGNDGSDPIPGC